MNILIVDDEDSVLDFLEEVLEEEGYKVFKAVNGQLALELINKHQISVVLMDIKMPGLSGFDILKKIQNENKNINVILMTAYSTTELAIQAMKLGAFDYIVKPFNIEELLLIIKKALEMQQLASEIKELRLQLEQVYQPETIIGNSSSMQEVYKIIGKVANTNATVLITGESGTGKELVAKAIHFNSNRHNGPFIKVNCAALPENLLESELFGHERGAFTGAVSKKYGLFELANNGSIFLDEIGEISLPIQAKLLRVLQEKEIQRVGGTESIKIDVRIIAATNKNLERMIKEGSFREDLYFRLNVIPIFLPPLRERKEDIPQLVQYFLNKYSIEFNKKIKGISNDALRILQNYDWPGNIRELENICERAVIMTQSNIILPEHLPINLTDFEIENDFKHLPLKEIIADIEKKIILKVLEETNWNRTLAAKKLGLNRRSLYAKMKEHKLQD
ncbi:two-component system, NtrC family, response regulator AtoC [Carboxydocella sporoproducens DSM 16521]|uniref:Stage 0 sporulation protein A homolog n=2 Tax=Carboxydocella TaxID=178898 RepID=A0A1T4PIY0_9FIRM|nr:MULTISPECIES: sigma-54 dependent transcriptional regulator [Carboxydocella]AVX19519.1 two-component system, NtrC family, response regulator AtoC [Carboxydocella thermautotrophica]SJZ91530.1 two-component system, NtrC family, response regulator AtoC [Carboxydocella sporoproducens DSM 16521]